MTDALNSALLNNSVGLSTVLLQTVYGLAGGSFQRPGLVLADLYFLADFYCERWSAWT